MHRGYTLNFFINTIKALPAKTVEKDFYKALAPRDGYESGKSAALDCWLGDNWGQNTLEILHASSKRARKLGATAKQRILTALKNRKTKGKVYA